MHGVSTCGCGQFAAGVCQKCGRAACSAHSRVVVLVEDRFLCNSCEETLRQDLPSIAAEAIDKLRSLAPALVAARGFDGGTVVERQVRRGLRRVREWEFVPDGSRQFPMRVFVDTDGDELHRSETQHDTIDDTGQLYWDREPIETAEYVRMLCEAGHLGRIHVLCRNMHHWEAHLL